MRKCKEIYDYIVDWRCCCPTETNNCLHIYLYHTIVRNSSNVPVCCKIFCEHLP